MLRQAQTHGGEITRFQNESDASNSLLHYAVKNNQLEILDYLLIL